MTAISKNALVPFSARQMYELVNDIDSYSDFLPWCKASTVLTSTEDELTAEIELSKGSLHKSFRTHNRMQPGKMIEMRLVEGPFKHLQGFWRFDALGDAGSKVSLDMEFEFSSKILGMTIGPAFSQICNSLVDAFCTRAKEIYGST